MLPCVQRGPTGWGPGRPPTFFATATLLVLLLAACGSPPEPTGTDVSEPDEDWLSVVRQRIADGEYAFREEPDGLHAVNRAQGLRARFDRDGVRVHARRGTAGWHLEIGLEAWGRPGATRAPAAALPRPGRCRDDGALDELGDCLRRLEQDHGDLLGWWVNDRSGLEQGWTIDTPPQGEGALVLDLAIDGLAVQVEPSGKAALLAGPGARLRYGGLAAFDALGAPLPARMEPTGSGLRLLIDDDGAPYPLEIDPVLTVETWSAEGANQAQLGHSVANAGDVNGDGFDDVLVGEPWSDGAAWDGGAAYLYLGSATGPSTTWDWVLEGTISNGHLGHAVIGAGDVNGDGLADVAVSAPDRDQFNGQPDGTVWVFHGSTTGLASTADWSSSSAVGEYGETLAAAGDVDGDGYGELLVGNPGYDVTTDGNQGRAEAYMGSASGLAASAAWDRTGTDSGDRLGRAIAGVGDVNGDGYGDVAVSNFGAIGPASTEDDDDSWYMGAVELFYGSSAGLPSSSSWAAGGLQQGAGWGAAVAGVGDFDGDGYADLAVGAPAWDGNYYPNEGAVFIHAGSSSGPGAMATWSALGNMYSASLGESLASAGDVNGDGFADLVAGAPDWDAGNYQDGAALLYLGGAASGTLTVSWVTLGGEYQEWRGTSVSSAGDVDGDGFSELLIGAPGWGGSSGGQDRGLALLFAGAGAGPAESPDWSDESNQDSALFGTSVAGVGDINRDARDDVVIGAPGYDGGYNNEGRVFFYQGTTSGLATYTSWTADGDAPDAALGSSVAGAGDVNDDGYDDLVVGAPGSSGDQGFFRVWYGDSPSPAADPDVEVSGTDDEQLGSAVAGAGDVNGDGYADVLVGAEHWSGNVSNEGGAWVYPGSPTGLVTEPLWEATGGQNGCLFGSALDGAGDVNGDGYGDIVVGASDFTDDQTNQGRISLYPGSPTGPGAPTHRYGASSQDYLGSSVAGAGDTNGDGYDDVVAGAPEASRSLSQEGVASLYTGSSGGIANTPSWTVTGGQSYEDFGASVAGAGDVDGDGYADVLVGAPFYGSGQTREGRVYLFRGAGAGLEASPSWDTESDQANARLGSSVASAGDIDGDGFGDVVLGAPLWDGGLSNEGSAFVHMGGGGDGTDSVLAPIPQLQDPSTSLARRPWTRASQAGYELDFWGASHQGRSRHKLEVEVKERGVPFDGIGTYVSTTWIDVGVSGQDLTSTIVGLGNENDLHWRARLLLDPSQAPAQGRTHWLWGGEPGSPLGVHWRTPCDADMDGDGACDSFDPDVDGDGYQPPTDCDDTLDTVYPGAPEVEDDGVDQDCNGFDLITCYSDGDLDGYGAGAATMFDDATSCAAVGYSEFGTDCNDALADVHPGAVEVCDGLDTDCDGVLPDDEADLDNDAQSECDGDCDDGNAAVYLGAPELCDGLDNDCDGSADTDEVDGDADGQMVCAGDCNDGDATIYDGASELCDGLDNDCDGVVPADEVDADADGHRVCDDDCNDGDPTIYDGAPELCDGWDNDCDGSLGAAEVDADSDDYYPCVYVTAGGNPAFGGGDCDDSEALANPGQEEVCDTIDNDCDGDIDEDLDGDGDGITTCSGDCDDSDPNVYPAAPEICDGKDDDCDGVLLPQEQDGDGDGWLICALDAAANEPAWVLGGEDCNDSAETIHPGATELCDGLDNDCNLLVPANENDGDGDGVMVCGDDCDDADIDTYPGAPELCDGLDNDCNGAVPGDELDEDADLQAPCDGDCNDASPVVYTGAPELCDGLDNDCDGSVPDDEIDDDTDGFDECAGFDCDDDEATVFPGAPELCDGLDNDCDGAVPAVETDDDGDGHDECGDGDCDDADAAVYPGAPEVCDGDDEDCDAEIDEGFDGDGDGVTSCAGDCDDIDATTFPGAPEACDGADNDCDGDIDEDFDIDGDGHLADSCDGGDDCDDDDPTVYLGAPEACDAVDDDCDGDIDETFDLDGDGWYDGAEVDCTAAWPQTDCDDADPAINPDALEVCDGIDNDCDGVVPTDETDGDGDGWVECPAPVSPLSQGGDCDDASAARYPGAPETCDGADDDCDGDIDEDFDADADGFFDGDVVLCAATYGGLADCDDGDGAVFPGATEVCDGFDDDCDGDIDDGFDDDLDSWTVCAGDCDDGDDAVHPGAVEVCDNGIDDDCDGLVDLNLDQDGDLVSICEGDCDDTDASVYPGATEECDGVDDDCDGFIDEEFDLDGDSYYDPADPGCAATWTELDCDESDAGVHPGAPELCDAVDQDCDGDIDEDFDLDVDGWFDGGEPDCASTYTAGTDCDDLAPATNPGAAESCNGIDDDCDGDVDEDFDADGDGAFTDADPGCVTLYGDDADCDDADATVAPGADELCNGVDDDCEGSVPEEETDADGDGWVECASPEPDHVDAPAGGGDCDDSDPTILPGAAETCDAIDQDCDGEVDEDFDGDGDGFADGAVPACEVAWGDQADCDDADAEISPAALEVCDAVDQDCDGLVDEDFDIDEDGWFDDDEPDCAGAWADLDCDDDDPAVFPFNVEDCTNGIDDNCDGQVDEDEDLDFDGVTTCAGDCDDGDAAVHPGAVETCDGRDEDCDLAIDEDFDLDGDGTSSCAGDCDDGDSGVHPGAPETCDGVDEDCDGAIDEVFDLDEDGVFTAFEGDCIDTYGLFNTDCDDDDPTVHPGAEELCDGIDQDCDGSLDDECTGDDDDSAVDDDDVVDDDDSAVDDDDSVIDDDDVADDDDAADDDDSAPAEPFYYAGCLLDCSLPGSGGGGMALALAAAALLLLVRRRRRSGSAALLAAMAIALPATAAASSLVVVTPDADRSARKLARELPRDLEVLFVDQQGEQVLGGLWLTGASAEFLCPESTLPAATVSEALAHAQRRLDELEMATAEADLAGVRQTVACLAEPVDGEELWRLYFLEGVAAYYEHGAPAAQPALSRALAVLPSHPYDDAYAPELRDLYLELQGQALGGGRAAVTPAHDARELPRALWVDGRPVAGPPVPLVPGEHVFQFRDVTGVLRGARVRVEADQAVALATPELLPAAAKKLEAGPQRSLARWLGARAGRSHARVWIHDGASTVCRLGEEVATVRRKPAKERPEARAAEHRPLILTLGGGYQSTGRGSYGALAFDVSLRLFKPLRLAVWIRPAISQPVIDPATGERLGRMGLLTLGIGPRLRFNRPIVQVIGLSLQLAPNLDGSLGGPVLLGPALTFGFDIPLGGTPLFLRPFIEVGTLGRFFQFRGALALGAAI